MKKIIFPFNGNKRGDHLAAKKFAAIKGKSKYYCGSILFIEDNAVKCEIEIYKKGKFVYCNLMGTEKEFSMQLDGLGQGRTLDSAMNLMAIGMRLFKKGRKDKGVDEILDLYSPYFLKEGSIISKYYLSED